MLVCSCYTSSLWKLQDYDGCRNASHEVLNDQLFSITKNEMHREHLRLDNSKDFSVMSDISVKCEQRNFGIS